MKTYSENDTFAYLEGRMAPADIHDFEESLRHDPLLRKQLLVLANFEAELPNALSEGINEASSPPVPSKRPVMRRVMQILLPLAAAAGVILAVRLMLPPSQPIGHGPMVAQAPAVIPVPPVIQVPVAGHLTEVNGNVLITEAHNESHVLFASSGMVVHVDATITLETNATATFAFTDGSVLRLYRETKLILRQSETGPDVELKRGALDGEIRPQPKGHMLVMHTQFLHADIVGTEFRLMADSKSAWVGVRKGAVRVTRETDGQKVELANGNYAAVAKDWPFMRMNARVCPVWKSICQQATGTPYP